MQLTAICRAQSWGQRQFTQKVFRVMKLTAIILLSAGLGASAKGISQTVTLDMKNAPVQNVFKEVIRQTGISIIYNEALLKDAPPVTINVKNVPLKDVLDICLGNQEIEYVIKDNTVEVKPKVKKTNVFTETFQIPPPPIDVHGRVLNDKGQPVEGATVTVKGTNKQVSTNANGEFILTGIDANATLIVSAVNIETYEIQIAGKTDLAINVKTKVTTGEIITVEVNTGYQKVKSNEITGSVVVINNEQLNRSVSPDILSRLNGITSGVLFQYGTRDNQDLRGNVIVRGYSTILSSKLPLIVVDDFPFEGDLSSINPNDVESITVLKDAAAASIWGTKAGNGVIVITTKKGKYNRALKVSVNSSLTVIEKPDIFYAPTLSSSDYIDVETFLFNRGFYNSSISSNSQPPLSNAVEILLNRRNGIISPTDSITQLNALRELDVRDDLLKYYYNRQTLQQYALNLSGGTHNQQYFASVGYDHNINTTNNYNRLTINASNTYSLLKNKLEITSGIWYSTSAIKNYASQYKFTNPYEQFADGSGNPLPIARLRQGYIDTAGGGKLLDWTYYPLKEIEYADNKTTSFNYRLNTGIKYRILKGLDIDLKYQYQKFQTENRNFNSLQTFDTRDLINHYTDLTQTNPNLRNPVPIGGILNQAHFVYTSQNLRGQLNYNNNWKQKHRLIIFGGAEIGDEVTKSNTFQYYGYNDENGTSISVDYVNNYKDYVTGDVRKIPANQIFSGLRNRIVSTYANMAYTYKDRYTYSMSGRRDGSNIFGTSTNNKWKPLISFGGSWDINKERFYKINWLPQLKLRATYGYQGNVDNSTSALLTINYESNPNIWNQLVGRVNNPPNPDLRWEKMRIVNIGLDFACSKNRITGSIDFYQKKGMDLLGYKEFAPSAGLNSTKTNSADMKGRGIDVVINSININRKIKWTTTFLFSYAKDWVTDYKLPPAHIGVYVQGSINPIIGRPVTALYSYKWAGLDPTSGDPQGYINQQVSKNYSQLLTSPDLNDLVYHGPTTAPYFGSLMNTLSWKQLSFSFNLIYKFGYYFRRPSINYSGLFSGSDPGNKDYTLRWQKPGDESFTNVPSLIYPADNNRDQFYNLSEILVEKGDHIRLQDIRVSYDLDKQTIRKLPFQNVRIYIYVSNIGVLWRANKLGIDPDYGYSNNYRSDLPGKKIAAGLTLNF